LKNILLVMSSSGYLVPPSVDPTHEKLWVETWKRLSRFLPDLRKELDLDSIEKQATEQAQDADSHPSVAPVS
jgi:golgi-specific brefeldin A-resistance guanine nucleotide exchange factor 1